MPTSGPPQRRLYWPMIFEGFDWYSSLEIGIAAAVVGIIVLIVGSSVRRAASRAARTCPSPPLAGRIRPELGFGGAICGSS
jgi:hypothetical protein